MKKLITLRMADAAHAELAAIAEESGMSASQFVRVAVKEKINRTRIERAHLEAELKRAQDRAA